MDNSILNTVKALLGIGEDYAAFDTEIILNINAALMTMNQLGLGPEGGFTIKGTEEKWSDFVGERTDLQAIQMCVYLKVRLGFDPPATSFGLEAIKNQISELEWRLNLQLEEGPHYG